MLSKKAFTLIELLVVISIVVLLIAILLPMLSKARESARVGACGSNERQIGIQIVVYQAENRDIMPRILDRHWGDPVDPSLAYSGQGRTWAGTLRDLTSIEMAAFRCPTDQRAYVLDRTDPEYFAVPIGGGAYKEFSYSAVFAGYNLRRSVWSTPERSGYIIYKGPVDVSHIDNPSKKLLIMDGLAPIHSHGGGMIPLVTDLQMYRGFWSETVFRHSSNSTDMVHGPNALYADGHVEMTINVTELTDSNVSLSN